MNLKVLGLVPKTPVGPAGYKLVDECGKRTPWCRQGQTVEESGSEGWLLCRNDHRIAGGLVWKKTSMSLQGEGCHVGLTFGGRRGISLPLEASWLGRRVVELGHHRRGICGTLTQAVVGTYCTNLEVFGVTCNAMTLALRLSSSLISLI